MPEHPSAPEACSTAVRTLPDAIQPVIPGANLLGSGLCPVCQEVELRGQRETCSPACRRKRSRLRETEARQGRDAEVRALLSRALELLDQEKSVRGGRRARGGSCDV